MCGIIAAASYRNVGELLVEGLHKMEYRGYDSAGLALHQESNIAHIRTLGKEGISSISEDAVINANYLRTKLNDTLDLPYDRICSHEVVFSAKSIKEKYGVNALDIAKRLIDYNIHPPTMYFPLIVDEALLVEPTETESKETLDDFIDVMKQIVKEAEINPELLLNAPHNTPNKRLNEALAARNPKLSWRDTLVSD